MNRIFRCFQNRYCCVQRDNESNEKILQLQDRLLEPNDDIEDAAADRTRRQLSLDCDTYIPPSVYQPRPPANSHKKNIALEFIHNQRKNREFDPTWSQYVQTTNNMEPTKQSSKIRCSHKTLERSIGLNALFGIIAISSLSIFLLLQAVFHALSPAESSAHVVVVNVSDMD